MHMKNMKTLREYIREAEEKKIAIGHFNFSNLDGLWAIFDAARELSAEVTHPLSGDTIPVIVGVSEGERDFVGMLEASLLIQHMRTHYNYPIFLNADHTYSVTRAQEAIEAGYDMVIYDGAEISYEENIENTRAVVAFKNEVHPECIIEAEFGFIGKGSDIKEKVPEGVSKETMTKPEEALRFVQETGIDALAPSVGNVHGMVKGGDPALDEERVAAIHAYTGVPLVLHGGSGSTDDDFRKVIHAGISVVHISTELRLSYRTALEEALKSDATLSPYKYLEPARNAMKRVVKERMKLFLGLV